VVQQRALDPSLPGLDEVIDALLDAAFGARARNAYEAEIARAVQRVVVDGVMELAGGAGMPQVRAVAALRLERRMTSLRGTASPDDATAAHAALVARDIQRFLDREGPEYTTPGTPDAPPGAPIGDAAMEWLRLAEPACTWVEVRQE
jgi:hypothetical protein